MVLSWRLISVKYRFATMIGGRAHVRTRSWSCFAQLQSRWWWRVVWHWGTTGNNATSSRKLGRQGRYTLILMRHASVVTASFGHSSCNPVTTLVPDQQAFCIGSVYLHAFNWMVNEYTQNGGTGGKSVKFPFQVQCHGHGSRFSTTVNNQQSWLG